MTLERVDESNPWTALETAVKFDCKYFSVRQDIVRHGKLEPRPYNSVRMKFHGVCVAPIDNEGCLTLVGQYRYVLDRFMWELPGGDSLQGRSHLDTVKAELSEETGLRAEHWLKIADAAISPGTSDEVASAYVAWGVLQGEPHPEPEERILLRRVPFDEAVGMALNGGIGDLQGVAVVLGIHARFVRGDLPESLLDLLRSL